MKNFFVAMILTIGTLFFLLGGEPTTFATEAVVEKTRVEIISNFSPLTAKILANGGDYVKYTGYRPDCKLVINVINIGNQRGSATGIAIPGYAIVFGGGSEKFPVALWGINSLEDTFPIGNIDVDAEHSSVAGIRLPTFRFVTANGSQGFDCNKVLEALTKWEPGLYEEGRMFRTTWSGPVPDCQEWGVFGNNSSNFPKYASLSLVERSADGTSATFQIEKIFVPLRTLFGKKVEYYK